MLKFIHKNMSIIIGIIVIVILSFLIKMQFDASAERAEYRAQVVEMKQLQEKIIRNRAEFVSKKDLDDFAKSIDLNLDVIKDDMNKQGAEVKGISTFLAKSLGVNKTNIPSTKFIPRPKSEKVNLPTCSDGSVCPDPYSYLTNQQVLGLYERFTNDTVIPFGQVGFSAWREKPWSLTVNPRDYRINTVLGIDDDGRHSVYNQMQVQVDGKSYKVPIEQAEFKEVYPESQFYFNPKIHLGVDVGAVVTEPSAEVIPNLQVSLFTYGRTKTNKDTEWSFLGIGAGYGTQAQSFNFVLTPVNYNLGQHIPLVESMHVGPTLSVNTNGDFLVLGGLRVGL